MLNCLKEIRDEMEQIAGDWNFEEDATMAGEIVEKIDELDKLIKGFNVTE